MNIGSLFARHARYRGDHTAVVFKDKRLTYRDFNREINRLSNALSALGIQRGDKVATLLPNSLELLETYWACSKIGAAVVPLSTLLMAKGIEGLLRDSDASAVITVSSFADILDGLRPNLPGIRHDLYLLTDGSRTGYRDYHALKAAASEQEPDTELSEEDVFNIMYSSGTTGMPKGIIHTHRIRAAYAMCFASCFRMTPESVTMHAGAIVFNGAFVDLMPTVYLGGTYVLLPQFDAESYIDAIEREKVTHVMMVPAQIIAFLNSPSFDPARLQSLEMILSLGAPLLMEHKERLTKALPGRFYELYGLTEGVVTVLDKNDYAAKPGSVGVPPAFFEVKILNEAGRECAAGEVGEICGKSPILMPGYYKRPDLTSAAIVDGLLHSGDMGYMDEDGFLFLVDRKKDMIISGGVNVYPRDIEEIVVQHPAVREAAVFGIPDEKWGEVPLAAVILKSPGAGEPEEIKAWVNQRVGAKFQRVSQVVVMDDFPRNVAGKTLKREMRDKYWAGRTVKV